MNGLALQVQEALRRDPHAGGGSTPASLARIMLRELGRDKSGSMSAVQPMSAATELLRGNEMTRIYLALTRFGGKV